MTIVGYGVRHLPVSQGKHLIQIPVFRAKGSTKDWLSCKLFVFITIFVLYCAFFVLFLCSLFTPRCFCLCCVWIAFFVGGNVRYQHPKQVVLNESDRFPHKTISCATVEMEVNVLKQGFPENVVFQSSNKKSI